MRAPTITTKACHAASRLGRMVNRALDESSLTPAGYRLLALLTAGGDSAATILAGNLRVSRPTVTATLDWLEARGLTSRSPDPADGRRVIVSATSKGKAALRDADRLVTMRLDEVLSLMSAREAAVAIDALECLHDALDADRARRLGLVTRAAQ